ncbi:membrane protein insertase YidC [Candidatus Similichlamydia laticola]|uniref:Membrane protein insertase YidC n=1 Tax=Candidatus Similichlamydia laticola TaxID=2170265 RepID=A0A369KC79_9BACT|nr:membrane protein insertase YidC [Candidatus Similichlamydia laticola]RDB31518.1 Inner membrane protein translocase component YidC, long form [Candidatus Similichlamydia laticola]
MSQSDHRQALRIAFALSISLLVSNWFLPYWGHSKAQPDRVVASEKSLANVSMEFLPTSTALSSPSEKMEQPVFLNNEEERSKETLLVLENGFFQIVVSTKGGSLKEINLPLIQKEEKNNIYAVRPVEIDKWVSSFSPEDASFPLQKEGALMKGPPHVVQYHPLIRRSLPSQKIFLPHYTNALALFSDYEDLSQLHYSVLSHTKDEIVLIHTGPTRKIRRIFQLEDSPYLLSAKIELEGDCRGLWMTSGIPETEILSNQPSPRVQFRHIKGNLSAFENVSLPKTHATLNNLNLQWVSNGNNFFGLILEPLSFAPSGFRLQMVPSEVAPTRLSLMPRHANKGFAPGYQVALPLPNQTGSYEVRVFAGPLWERILREVDEKVHPIQHPITPSYCCNWSSQGWFSKISSPFSKLLAYLLPRFHAFTGSWVLAIVLLTLFLRIVLYPFNAWAFRSMEKVRRLAPQVQAIQEQYRDIPHKAQAEIFALYKQHKINPILGLLPLLAQMPFLLGMFEVLKSSFELRGASVVPGWIDNLAAPDVLVSWSYPVLPIIGNQIHLLPICLAFSMYIQQRWAMEGTQQKRTPTLIMTSLFLCMFYKFPAGLNIYWMSSILLGMAQQALTRRQKLN